MRGAFSTQNTTPYPISRYFILHYFVTLQNDLSRAGAEFFCGGDSNLKFHANFQEHVVDLGGVSSLFLELYPLKVNGHLAVH